jgi:hypothetical protein
VNWSFHNFTDFFPGKRLRSTFLYWCCIGIALVAGCVEPFNPISPSWDVTLNVPVVNHTYTIQEIIDNDPSVFKADQNGVLLYTTSTAIKPTTVGNSLLLTDDSTVFHSISLGTFSIDDASTTSRPVTIGRIAPELGPLNGTLSPVPETQFAVSSIPMDTISEFREATIVDGTLIVEIQNNFPTAINNLVLTFYDQWSDQYGEIATVTFPAPIPSKGSASHSYPLTARKMGNRITFNASGILMSSGSPVLIDTSAGVRVGVRFTAMRVREGEARIPEINFTTQRTYHRSDPSSINQAEIQSGQLSLVADIPFDGSGRISIQIPNLTVPGGGPFRPIISVARKQNHIDTTLQLDGYFFSARNQQINYTIDIHVDDSGDEYVHLDAADSIKGTIKFSKIILNSFSGVLKPTSIAVKHSISIDVQSMNKLITGTVRFADASLILGLQSPPQGFEFDLSGSISGFNTRTGKTASLTIPSDQQRINPGADSIVFPGSAVAAFLNGFTPNLPDSLTINAVALINPTGTEESTIRSTDTISATVRFTLPFHLSITGAVYQDTVVFGDSENKGKSDISKDKSRNVQSARMSIELENSLPVALGIDTLKFLDSEYRTLLTIPKQGQPAILVQSGVVTGGIVTQPAKSTSYIELNHADASQFESATYIVISLRLDTPATEPVRFRSTDWVKIKAWATVNYRANQ